MVKNQNFSVESSKKSIKCAICHHDIDDFTLAYQPHLNLGIVCADCCMSFSQEDLIIIMELLIMYGGYFGKLRDRSFSLINELKKIDIPNCHNISFTTDEFILEINSRLLHKALLHGIYPEEYIEELKKYLDKPYDNYFL